MRKYLNLPAFLVSAYVIRLLLVGASLGDSITILALSSLYFLTYYFKSHKDEPVNKLVIDRIVELEETVKATKEKMNSFSLGNHLKR